MKKIFLIGNNNYKLYYYYGRGLVLFKNEIEVYTYNENGKKINLTDTQRKLVEYLLEDQINGGDGCSIDRIKDNHIVGNPANEKKHSIPRFNAFLSEMGILEFDLIETKNNRYKINSKITDSMVWEADEKIDIGADILLPMLMKIDELYDTKSCYELIDHINNNSGIMVISIVGEKGSGRHTIAEYISRFANAKIYNRYKIVDNKISFTNGDIERINGNDKNIFILDNTKVLCGKEHIINYMFMLAEAGKLNNVVFIIINNDHFDMTTSKINILYEEYRVQPLSDVVIDVLCNPEKKIILYGKKELTQANNNIYNIPSMEKGNSIRVIGIDDEEIDEASYKIIEDEFSGRYIYVVYNIRREDVRKLSQLIEKKKDCFFAIADNMSIPKKIKNAVRDSTFNKNLKMLRNKRELMKPANIINLLDIDGKILENSDRYSLNKLYNDNSSDENKLMSMIIYCMRKFGMSLTDAFYAIKNGFCQINAAEEYISKYASEFRKNEIKLQQLAEMGYVNRVENEYLINSYQDIDLHYNRHIIMKVKLFYLGLTDKLDEIILELMNIHNEGKFYRLEKFNSDESRYKLNKRQKWNYEYESLVYGLIDFLYAKIKVINNFRYEFVRVILLLGIDLINTYDDISTYEEEIAKKFAPRILEICQAYSDTIKNHSTDYELILGIEFLLYCYSRSIYRLKKRNESFEGYETLDGQFNYDNVVNRLKNGYNCIKELLKDQNDKISIFIRIRCDAANSSLDNNIIEKKMKNPDINEKDEVIQLFDQRIKAVLRVKKKREDNELYEDIKNDYTALGDTFFKLGQYYMSINESEMAVKQFDQVIRYCKEGLALKYVNLKKHILYGKIVGAYLKIYQLQETTEDKKNEVKSFIYEFLKEIDISDEGDFATFINLEKIEYFLNDDVIIPAIYIDKISKLVDVYNSKRAKYKLEIGRKCNLVLKEKKRG